MTIFVLMVVAAAPWAEVQEEIEMSDVLEAVGSQKRALVACGEAERKRDPEGEDKVVMTFTVEPSSGKVTVTGITPTLPDFSKCLTSAMGAARFPIHRVQHAPFMVPLQYRSQPRSRDEDIIDVLPHQPDLAESDIVALLETHREAFMQCRQAQSARAPKAHGEIVISITAYQWATAKILKDTVKPEAVDFAQCNAKAIEAIPFPIGRMTARPMQWPFKY